jgi:hypothetical protein
MRVFQYDTVMPSSYSEEQTSRPSNHNPGNMTAVLPLKCEVVYLFIYSHFPD